MKLRVTLVSIIFVQVFLSSSLKVKAQGPQLLKVIPPSPNVQALQKYGEIPVSSYTGIPNISIPVYTVKFHDISVPISLSYHASGIKVGEEASRVGLGWALNAGGVISRTIMGADDFDGTLYFNGIDNTLPDFTNGYFPEQGVQEFAPCILRTIDVGGSQTQSTLDITNALNNVSTPRDFEPDHYYFNFADQSGKFILKRDKATVVLEKPQNIKVSLVPYNGFYAWKIVNVDGYVYDFEKTESYHPNADPVDHKSAWYLTKITSPTGNIVTFNYTTVTNDIQSLGSYAETKDFYQTPGNNAFAAYVFPEQKGMTPIKPYTQVLLSSIDFTNGQVDFTYSSRDDLQNDQKLDKISIYSKDASGVKSTQPVKFFDLSYAYFDNGADNDYGPNTPQPATGYYSKRLKLLSITEKGYDNLGQVANNPYSFIYYEGGTFNLPAKSSFARDHWGYYNGKTTNSSLAPNYTNLSLSGTYDYLYSILGTPDQSRDADNTLDLSYMKAWSLKTLQYPTGGSTDFVYEANDFDEQASQINDQSYFSKSYTIVRHADADDMTGLLYDNGTFHGWRTSNIKDLTDLYLYSNDQLGYVELDVPIRFSNPLACPYSFANYNAVKFTITDESNTEILSQDLKDALASELFCGGTTNTFKKNIYLKPGHYTIQIFVNDANLPSGNHLQDVHFNFIWYTRVSSNPNSQQTITFSNAGGLRIKRIIDHDGVNPVNDRIKRFIYHYWQDKNNTGLKEYSYGKRMSRPEYRYFVPGEELHHSKPQGSGGLDIISEFMSYHLMHGSDSNIPLNGSAAGSVVGYDSVIVLDGENGEFGKTVYGYHNNPDIIGNYVYDGLPIMPPSGSSIPDPLNGSLIQETIYKAVNTNNSTEFIPVQNTQNSYYIGDHYDPSKPLKYNITYALISEKILRTQTWPGSSPSTQDFGPCTGYIKSYHSLNSEWSYLSNTTKKVFDQADQSKYALTSTDYFYESGQHFFQTKTVVNNSLAENINTHISYPLDFTSQYVSNGALGIQNLKDKNVVNAPVEVYVDKSNKVDGSNLRVVSGVLTSYSSANALPKPSLLYALNPSTPITNYLPASIDASGLHIDNTYKPAVYIDAYDANGNVLQQRKDKDVAEFYIWDYKNSFPVAECVFPLTSNTSNLATDIGYTSFEWDSKGNFTYSGTVTPVTLTADYSGMPPTGNRFYNLTGTDILTKNGLTINKVYIISYWSDKATPYTINGVSNASYKVGRTFNTIWTYYEHTVTATGNTINISGTGKLDEVRIYPKGAQMTTYSYNPLFGITSIANITNNITYYQYDGLGRLAVIRDQDKNVVKKFNYYYKGSIPPDPNPNDCGCNTADGTKKCINGFCETGIRTNTSTRWVSSIQQWKCTYYYVFSDKSHTGPFDEYNTFTPCDIDYVP